MTVYDATKEELIQYFFHPIGGGFRIPSDAERFCIWLKNKRTQELIDAQDETAETSRNALNEYISLVKQANNETDIDRKIELFNKANRAYERYEKANKLYDKQGRAIDKALGLGKK